MIDIYVKANNLNTRIHKLLKCYNMLRWSETKLIPKTFSNFLLVMLNPTGINYRDYNHWTLDAEYILALIDCMWLYSDSLEQICNVSFLVRECLELLPAHVTFKSSNVLEELKCTLYRNKQMSLNTLDLLNTDFCRTSETYICYLEYYAKIYKGKKRILFLLNSLPWPHISNLNNYILIVKIVGRTLGFHVLQTQTNIIKNVELISNMAFLTTNNMFTFKVPLEFLFLKERIPYRYLFGMIVDKFVKTQTHILAFTHYFTKPIYSLFPNTYNTNIYFYLTNYFSGPNKCSVEFQFESLVIPWYIHTLGFPFETALFKECFEAHDNLILQLDYIRNHTHAAIIFKLWASLYKALKYKISLCSIVLSNYFDHFNKKILFISTAGDLILNGTYIINNKITFKRWRVYVQRYKIHPLYAMLTVGLYVPLFKDTFKIIKKQNDKIFLYTPTNYKPLFESRLKHNYKLHRFPSINKSKVLYKIYCSNIQFVDVSNNLQYINFFQPHYKNVYCNSSYFTLIPHSNTNIMASVKERMVIYNNEIDCPSYYMTWTRLLTLLQIKPTIISNYDSDWFYKDIETIYSLKLSPDNVFLFLKQLYHNTKLMKFFFTFVYNN